MAIQFAVTSSITNTHKALQTESIIQVADRLICPQDVLCCNRQKSPKPKPVRANSSTPHIMDKRHPSSFQQLEKVRTDTCSYGMIALLTWPCSLVKEPTQQYDLIAWACSYNALIDALLGFQGPESPDWRVGGTERDPPRLRRRHSLDGDSGDLLNERAQT